MKYFTRLASFIPLLALVKAEFIYSCTEKKTIALTFDDGPHSYTRELVDYMRKQSDVKITFFTVAKFHYPFAIDTEEFQDAMKVAHDSGFQIASHTYSHKIPDDPSEFKKVLDDNDDFIQKVTGDRPRYFRAPKGECSNDQQKKLDEWGYRLIQWDTDTNDWDLETSGSEEQRVEDSINFLKKEFAEERDNYLILMHDSQNYTVRNIAPWIIEKSGMKEKGYRFVTVAECLGDKNGMYTSGKTYDQPDNNTEDKDHHKDDESTGKNDNSNTNNDNTNTNNDNKATNQDESVVTDKIEHNLTTSDAYSMKTSFIYSFICLFFCVIYTLIN